MTGKFRVAVVFFVVLFGMTALVGCGGGGAGGDEAGNGGGGEGIAGTDDQSGGSERSEAPPNVEGTWIGHYGEVEDDSEGGVTIMFDFDQDGESLYGSGTTAITGDEYPLYFPSLSGRVTPSGELTVTEEVAEGSTVPPFSYEAQVTGDTMKLWGADASESEAIDFEKVQTDYPEELGIAAVQAVYNRDWMWFSQRVSDDTEDYLENYEVEPNESFDELTQQADLHFEDDMEYEDEEDKPRVGVGVTLDEESVVVRETEVGTAVEFDYTTSTGGSGEVLMRLIQAGTASSGYTTRIDNFEMDYETEDGGEARDVTF